MHTVGAMLPFDRPLELTDPGEYASMIKDRGYEAAWVRDWPLGQPSRDGTLEHSSGWDPLTLISLLAAHASGELTFGTGILRTDYRLSTVTARAVVSVMAASRGRLQVGLGAGPMREPGAPERFATAVGHISHLLNGDYREEFVLPDDFAPPPLLLACQRPDVWEKVEGAGLITTVLNPRALDTALTTLRKIHNPTKVVLLASLDLCVDDADQVENQRPFLRLGERALRRLVAAWQDLGVREVVLHTPAATPGAIHQRLVAIMKEST